MPWGVLLLYFDKNIFLWIKSKRHSEIPPSKTIFHFTDWANILWHFECLKWSVVVDFIIHGWRLLMHNSVHLSCSVLPIKMSMGRHIVMDSYTLKNPYWNYTVSYYSINPGMCLILGIMPSWRLYLLYFVWKMFRFYVWLIYTYFVP